jgi:hypothetical protein
MINMKMNRLFDIVDLKPKEFFVVDGFGAILSAFLLGVVLVKMESVFGIPSSTLHFLATLPVLFAIYDLYCFSQLDDKLGHLLMGIAVINLLYCCLSIGFAFYHFQTITVFGWAYIIIEILIVTIIAIFELKTAKSLTKNYD